jgi:myo-inositol 2-dehydrogenase/D-chiro-inositol 1-dehydrogenase
MRIAQLGAGTIGRLHARLLTEEGGPDSVVIFDADGHRARQVADETGAGLAASRDEAFASADALVIAASSGAHAELIRAGLERRLPIFCEKPLAPTLDETQRLVGEIEAAGTPFQLGFQRRFDPGYVEARRRVSAGELGTLYLVRMVASDHSPPPDAYIPISGGIFRDSSIHDFDAIRWMTGSEVESVYADGEARGFEMLARQADVGTVACVLRMRNGVLGVLGAGRHNPRGYDIRMELIGSADAVAMGLTERTPIEPLDAGRPQSGAGWDSFLDRFEPAYREELRAFIRVAGDGAPSACTARDGLEAIRVAEAAALSLAEHRPVALDEIAGAAERGGALLH